MDEKIRSFIALELSSEIQTRITNYFRDYQLAALTGLRWMKVENIHLTLKFLGELTPIQLTQISHVLGQVSQGLAPFSVNVSGVGSFPSWSHPRTIWIGVKPTINLVTLFTKLDEETAKIGVPSDGKRFSPHLTLCRVSDHADPLAISKFTSEIQAEIPPDFGTLNISRIVLFRSQLKRGGSIYTPLSFHPFREHQ